jgi:ribosomal protein S27AE
MPESQPAFLIKYPVERRSCPNCKMDMMIIRIMPDKQRYQLRTFECTRCGDETVLIATSALNPFHTSSARFGS